MSALLDRFLNQIQSRGLSIERGEGDTLNLKGPTAEKTPEVIKACKSFKTELLNRFPSIEQANNQSNTVHLTTAEMIDRDFATAPAPAKEPGQKPMTDPSEWTTCEVCQADVNVHQMSDLPFGIWMEFCGRDEERELSTKKLIRLRCPFHPSSR